MKHIHIKHLLNSIKKAPHHSIYPSGSVIKWSAEEVITSNINVREALYPKDPMYKAIPRSSVIEENKWDYFEESDASAGINSELEQ
jgi:hypothetical protein